MTFGANAATVITDATGLLLGAKGVTVSGALYDVQFVDGTYSEVYGASSPLFTTLSDGLAAMNAILYEVVQSPGPRDYEFQPEWVNGCQFGSQLCRFVTPYFDETQGAVWFSIGENYPWLKAADEVYTLPVVPQFGSGDWVWARWTVASATVPEPSGLSLALVALAAAMMARRRAKGLTTAVQAIC
ncbi:hypothetical protein D621_19685 [beta proteobacterium AAP51]|nr:hypothetical protein D621_19685 [beta proteobacterium AAP51]